MVKNEKFAYPRAIIAWLLSIAVIGIIIFDVVGRRLSTPNRSFTILGQFLESMLFDFSVPAVLSVVLIAGLMWLAKRKVEQRSALRLWVRALLVFSGIWLVYMMSAYFVDVHWWTPLKSYFPDLAAAFLQGRTYLETPGAFVDLTLFNGRWYVSFPPLAALLMLPQVALYGPDSVNTVYFTIFLGAANGALIYLLLEKAAQLNWTKLGSADNAWLVALFAFGTVHWYMSLTGQVWYISQVLTVTFSALAVLLAFQNRSALVVGIAWGLAMLARPNVIFLWPLLFAIFCQLNHIDRSALFGRQTVRWTVLSAIPVVVVVAGLLWYNAIRFGSLFDFGYSNMNVGDYLKPDLQTYGQFNIHFLLRNLRTFFLGLPFWNKSCGFFGVDENGLSVLITTPALFYLFRAFKKGRPWIWGAWISVFLLFVVIMLYFNTGGLQFGYRFLMDMILPLMLLLALAAGERVSLAFKILILCGVLVNYYGLLWFFVGYCH